MAQIIGSTTTYQGTEHPYLSGLEVRIIAVLKNAARPDFNADGADYAHITDDDALARAGGVTVDDRLEVQPWMMRERRFSFVTSDPRAIDLALFKHLTTEKQRNQPAGAAGPRRLRKRKRQ